MAEFEAFLTGFAGRQLVVRGLPLRPDE